jgi:hypothetical protein
LWTWESQMNFYPNPDGPALFFISSSLSDG